MRKPPRLKGWPSVCCSAGECVCVRAQCVCACACAVCVRSVFDHSARMKRRVERLLRGKELTLDIVGTVYLRLGYTMCS